MEDLKNKDTKSDWKLEEIRLRFMTYGDDKGKYAGNIKFSNGEDESFSFKIRPDMAEAYIKLMSKDIVTSAENLGSRLVESLGLGE